MRKPPSKRCINFTQLATFNRSVSTESVLAKPRRSPQMPTQNVLHERGIILASAGQFQPWHPMGLVEVGDITLKQGAEKEMQGISSCNDVFPMVN